VIGIRAIVKRARPSPTRPRWALSRVASLGATGAGQRPHRTPAFIARAALIGRSPR
jgi:hypothetical protein